MALLIFANFVLNAVEVQVKPADGTPGIDSHPNSNKTIETVKYVLQSQYDLSENLLLFEQRITGKDGFAYAEFFFTWVFALELGVNLFSHW